MNTRKAVINGRLARLLVVATWGAGWTAWHRGRSIHHGRRLDALSQRADRIDLELSVIELTDLPQ